MRVEYVPYLVRHSAYDLGVNGVAYLRTNPSPKFLTPTVRCLRLPSSKANKLGWNQARKGLDRFADFLSRGICTNGDNCSMGKRDKGSMCRSVQIATGEGKSI